MDSQINRIQEVSNFVRLFETNGLPLLLIKSYPSYGDDIDIMAKDLAYFKQITILLKQNGWKKDPLENSKFKRKFIGKPNIHIHLAIAYSSIRYITRHRVWKKAIPVEIENDQGKLRFYLPSDEVQVLIWAVSSVFEDFRPKNRDVDYQLDIISRADKDQLLTTAKKLGLERTVHLYLDAINRGKIYRYSTISLVKTHFEHIRKEPSIREPFVSFVKIVKAWKRKLANSQLIYLGGMDGSGKTSHGKEIVSWLLRNGTDAENLHMVGYLFVNTLSALKSRKKRKRRESRKFTTQSQRGRLSFLRPYLSFLDNAIYWPLKIIPPLTKGKWIILDRCLFDYFLRYKLLGYRVSFLERYYWRKLPKVGIILDVPAHIAFARKPEFPLEFFDKQRKAYLHIAKKMGYKVINSDRTFVEVQKEITEYLNTLIL